MSAHESPDRAAARETSVLLALTGLVDEPHLVRAAASARLVIVRRCVDAVDLLGAAAADQDSPVILASSLPRLSADVVARLGDRLVIGIAGDALGRERLMRLGVDPVIDLAPAAESTMQQVGDVCRAHRVTARPRHVSPRVVLAAPGTPADAPSVQADVRAPVPAPGPRATHGRIWAVWGPPGAPGRTTVALGVAEALAERGRRVCLVDADTYAPSIALALGLVESTSGLASACRLAEAGTLTPAGLCLLTMAPGSTVGRRGEWCVLGGLQATSRWPDLRPAALERVWQVARSAFDVTVVDVGACLEHDDGPTAFARQRNAAALSALATADDVIAVADGSALGAARLVAAWAQLPDPRPRTTLVRNRAARNDAGWRAAVASRIPTVSVVDVPVDRRAIEQAWARGASLREAAPRSRARRALAELAGALDGPPRAASMAVHRHDPVQMPESA